jgi:DNA methylase
LEEIDIAKRWIETEAPQRWRTTLRVLLSSVLKRCSRVRDYHYTYIVDRSRVKRPAENNPELARYFSERIVFSFRAGANMRTALLSQGRVELDRPPSFKRTSAGDVGHVMGGEIDIVLTSPPYFGMNDYVRSQYLTSLVYPSQDFERDLRIESGSRRMRTSAPALKGYLDDMVTAFAECRRVLRPGGFIAIFLGHSQSKLAREANVLGKLDDSLRGLGFDSIWSGERRIRFRKITSTPSSSEHVWILRRR